MTLIYFEEKNIEKPLGGPLQGIFKKIFGGFQLPANKNINLNLHMNFYYLSRSVTYFEWENVKKCKKLTQGALTPQKKKVFFPKSNSLAKNTLENTLICHLCSPRNIGVNGPNLWSPLCLNCL